VPNPPLPNGSMILYLPSVWPRNTMLCAEDIK